MRGCDCRYARFFFTHMYEVEALMLCFKHVRRLHTRIYILLTFWTYSKICIQYSTSKWRNVHIFMSLIRVVLFSAILCILPTSSSGVEHFKDLLLVLFSTTKIFRIRTTSHTFSHNWKREEKQLNPLPHYQAKQPFSLVARTLLVQCPRPSSIRPSAFTSSARKSLYLSMNGAARSCVCIG